MGLPSVNTLRVFTMVALFRGLKLLTLLLIILRGTKSFGISYQGLTLGLLGVYNILMSSSLKLIFSRRSPRLFAGFSEFFSPTLGDSKIIITKILFLSIITK